MNLHEYQAKQIFEQYNLPVPKGVLINSADEAIAAAQQLHTQKIVLKAQVHAGGRGKAGGVKLLDKDEDLVKVAGEMLHKNLVTYQTNSHGHL